MTLPTSPAPCVSSDADLRKLLDNGVLSATQLNSLLVDNRGNLGPLLANLVTLGQIQVARLPGLDELLTLYPRVLSAGARVVQDPVQGRPLRARPGPVPGVHEWLPPASHRRCPTGARRRPTRATAQPQLHGRPNSAVGRAGIA